MSDTVKMKKEYFRAWMVCETLESESRYCEAKCAAARVVGCGGKNLTLEGVFIRSWRKTIGWPQIDSRKLSSASGGESSPLLTLFSVEVGRC